MADYRFLTTWLLEAPREAVFQAVWEWQSWPSWWRGVESVVELEPGDADGVGTLARHVWRSRLPYRLQFEVRTTRVERPRLIEGETEGDLRGRGIWTLTPTETGTHVRFDWRVHADRPLLRALTPLLRPALRWNHDWAIARAQEGLEPYVSESLAR